jgi:predicted 3-demethylubiquinone-9 3-methyltransferase (glyoxalase superfamily)
MKTVTPFLWYDTQAAEAAQFYCSVFKNSKLVSEGSISVTFEIDGLRLTAFNGGPLFKFNEGISLCVDCGTQEEVDYYWSRFIDGGGMESRCGWLKDRFGLSWQIIPSILPRLLSDPDRAKAGRSMQAMLKMKKIVIADLEQAVQLDHGSNSGGQTSCIEAGI